MYKHGTAPDTIRASRMAWPLVALCALVALLGAASAAKAETVSIGHLDASYPGNSCTNCHLLQVASSLSAGYVVPAGDWTISSWSARSAEKEGAVRLDVYRPTGVEGQYQVLAQSAFENVHANSEPSFPVTIPVQGGDLIALSTGLGAYPALANTNDEADKYGSIAGSPAVGQTVGGGTPSPVNVAAGRTLNIAATLTRPDPLPAIAAPAPLDPPAPAATLSLGKQHRKHGSKLVSQVVTVSGPGTLGIAGKGIAPRRITTTGAGPITVTFAPKGRLLGSLTRLGKAKGTAQIVFTPTAGTAATRTETVHFRLAR